MEKMRLAITLTDGQVLYAEPRPEDEPQLAELLGDRSAFEFGSSDDDLEGHAISTDIVVDVEGHAMVLRLPHAADAAAVRRALAVGAVTAAIVGAGVIAGLHPAAPTTTTIEQAPAAQVQAIPGPALRAQRDEMQREQVQQETLTQQTLQSVPLDADNPLIPAQALRAEGAQLQSEQQVQSTQIEQTLQSVPLDADNPAVPAQALRAGTSEARH